MQRLQLLLILCAGLALAVPGFAQTVDRPAWRPGDAWRLRITVASPAGRTVTEVVRTVGAPRAAGRPEDEPADAAATGTPDPKEDMRWLRFPLAPGKTYVLDNGRGQTWSATVRAWTSVTVPAGTFRALEVALVRGGKGKQYAAESLWYAPDAKCVVRRVSVRPWSLHPKARETTTTELLEHLPR